MSWCSSGEVLEMWVKVWNNFSDAYGSILGGWFELKSFETQKRNLYFQWWNSILQQGDSGFSSFFLEWNIFPYL